MMEDPGGLGIDHVVLCVPQLASAERVLSDFGLEFGLHATHEGQGTRNACAFFDNAYVELLAPHDEGELRSAAVQPLGLWERLRWQETGASPFGVGLRASSSATLPTWPYEAPFLPSGLTIPIVTAPHAYREPLVFMITPDLPIRRRPSVPHRGRRRTLSRVVVAGPAVLPAAGMLHSACDTIAFREAPEHSLTLCWDREPAGESHDFRPSVPLVLRW